MAVGVTEFNLRDGTAGAKGTYESSRADAGVPVLTDESDGDELDGDGDSVTEPIAERARREVEQAVSATVHDEGTNRKEKEIDLLPASSESERWIEETSSKVGESSRVGEEAVKEWVRQQADYDRSA
jgi:hypothetical protein